MNEAYALEKASNHAEAVMHHIHERLSEMLKRIDEGNITFAMILKEIEIIQDLVH